MKSGHDYRGERAKALVRWRRADRAFMAGRGSAAAVMHAADALEAKQHAHTRWFFRTITGVLTKVYGDATAMYEQRPLLPMVQR